MFTLFKIFNKILLINKKKDKNMVTQLADRNRSQLLTGENPLQPAGRRRSGSIPGDNPSSRPKPEDSEGLKTFMGVTSNCIQTILYRFKDKRECIQDTGVLRRKSDQFRDNEGKGVPGALRRHTVNTQAIRAESEARRVLMREYERLKWFHTQLERALEGFKNDSCR
ncbi:MAG: hypothetical protein FJZ63_08120 [Chlamydiae bacterium]|nr:hypothetical protein [Chlamydiota bacterium]